MTETLETLSTEVDKHIAITGCPDKTLSQIIRNESHGTAWDCLKQMIQIVEYNNIPHKNLWRKIIEARIQELQNTI